MDLELQDLQKWYGVEKNKQTNGDHLQWQDVWRRELFGIKKFQRWSSACSSKYVKKRQLPWGALIFHMMYSYWNAVQNCSFALCDYLREGACAQYEGNCCIKELVWGWSAPWEVFLDDGCRGTETGCRQVFGEHVHEQAARAGGHWRTGGVQSCAVSQTQKVRRRRRVHLEEIIANVFHVVTDLQTLQTSWEVSNTINVTEDEPCSL